MKDIVSLRNHLFDALNRLAEAAYPEDLENEINKSAAIVQVAEAIIKSAEVENNFISITKGFGSGFIPVINDKKSLIDLVSAQLNEKEKENEVEYFNEEKDGVAFTDQGDVTKEGAGLDNHKLHKLGGD